MSWHLIFFFHILFALRAERVSAIHAVFFQARRSLLSVFFLFQWLKFALSRDRRAEVAESSSNGSGLVVAWDLWVSEAFIGLSNAKREKMTLTHSSAHITYTCKRRAQLKARISVALQHIASTSSSVSSSSRRQCVLLAREWEPPSVKFLCCYFYVDCCRAACVLTLRRAQVGCARRQSYVLFWSFLIWSWFNSNFPPVSRPHLTMTHTASSSGLFRLLWAKKFGDLKIPKKNKWKQKSPLCHCLDR